METMPTENGKLHIPDIDELPAVNFEVGQVKRCAEEYLSSHQKKLKFDALMDELKQSSESTSNVNDSVLQLLNCEEINLEDTDSESEVIQPVIKIVLPPITIEKKTIDIQSLLTFTKDNINEILELPFQKDTFAESDAPEYLEVYSEESNRRAGWFYMMVCRTTSSLNRLRI